MKLLDDVVATMAENQPTYTVDTGAGTCVLGLGLPGILYESPSFSEVPFSELRQCPAQVAIHRFLV